MIHWRFGGWTDAGLPSRARAEEWLCAAERERYASFKVEKRREDWLVGRVNAKALAVDAIAYRYGVRLEPRLVQIARRPSGAPQVELDPAAVALGLPATPPVSLSNTHSSGHAMCGLVWLDGYEASRPIAGIGVDVEWIEPRSEGFIDDFLTPAEREWCRAGSDADKQLRANLVWSAKESVLKVVERGLSVDTYWVSCTPAPNPADDWLAAMLTPVDGEWEPLEVAVDPRFPDHGLQFRVLWREILGFVATMAVGVRQGGSAIA